MKITPQEGHSEEKLEMPMEMLQALMVFEMLTVESESLTT
ncbi:unnamed protein product [Larinioides sclopetarius]|uniref:Uncharacterized protein n=1 Tax=Larinioides sclopetarius TaxID=280406 RepID=A0AAV2AXS8_9ARAC